MTRTLKLLGLIGTTAAGIAAARRLLHQSTVSAAAPPPPSPVAQELRQALMRFEDRFGS